MPTVRLPAQFVSYACQRSQMCCKHPVRAPCNEDDEARITRVLASSDAGRSHLPIFQGGFETVLEMRAFKQDNERCVHLVGPADATSLAAAESGCSLHFIGGLDALSTACRNYPRWIAQLPPEPGSDAVLEALFLLTCPTAARLLVQDPSPFRFVEVPLETWVYTAAREATTETLALAVPLRAAWWGLLADRRHDTERLTALLDAMYTDPLTPPTTDPVMSSPPSEGLLRGLRSGDVHFLHDVLERIPDRGQFYAPLHWELRGDLIGDVTPRQLMDALDIAPELLAAYLDQMVPFAGLHDSRPVPQWLRAAVRRTVAVARMADSLLARVPFGINTLFGDLFAAAMHPDTLAVPTEASRSAALDKGVA